jgi:hypothetical protein
MPVVGDLVIFLSTLHQRCPVHSLITMPECQWKNPVNMIIKEFFIDPFL